MPFQSMSVLTGVLYAALVAYLGGWYAGRWSGNFALLLFLLTAVTLLYWLAERFYFVKQREKVAQEVAAHWEKEQTWRGGDLNPAARQVVMEPHLRQPWWLDWTAGLFPGHPRRLPAAQLPVRALQDPVGLHGADAAGG